MKWNKLIPEYKDYNIRISVKAQLFGDKMKDGKIPDVYCEGICITKAYIESMLENKAPKGFMLSELNRIVNSIADKILKEYSKKRKK